MTRPEWLASLKVGDSVGVSGDYTLELGTVTKVTPSRRVTVNDRYTFDADGDQYPRPTRYAGRYTLHQTDDAFMVRLARHNGDRLRVELIARLHAYQNVNAPKDFDFTTHNTALRACLDALGRKP